MAGPRPFEHWVAVVTGGAGGLGRAIASRLVERGVRCLLVDINEAALANAARELGPSALTHVADLTNPAAREQLVQRGAERVRAT